MNEKAIHKTIYGQFQSGLHCAEAVSKTVLEIFSDESHPKVIKSASGFGGGIGGSMGELCGAFTGGVIALGFLTGREEPGGSLKECGGLINEYKTREDPGMVVIQSDQKNRAGQCPFSAQHE